MKGLLAVFSVALMLIAAPAAADYSACMKFCKEEYDFSHCHKLCTEDMGKMPAANTGVVGGEEHMIKNYDQLAGNTYKITNNIVSSVEIMRFGHDGHTEYVQRSCFGELYCEGSTKINDGMVVSEFECENYDQVTRMFKLGEVKNFEHFTVVVHSPRWDRAIGMDYVKVEDQSQVSESGC